MDKLAAFLAIVKKDLKLFFRRRTTTALVVFTPLLIIMFLGVLFGGEKEVGSGRLAVAICDYDQSELSHEYAKGLSEFKLLSVTDYSNVFATQGACTSFATTNTRRGVFAFSLSFRKGFQDALAAGDKQGLEVVFDNSKPELVGFEQYYVDAVTRQISSQTSVRFISRAWERMRAADAKMVQVLDKLPVAIGNVDRALYEVGNLKAGLSQFDASGTQGKAQQVSAGLASASDYLNRAGDAISQARASIALLKASTGTIRAVYADVYSKGSIAQAALSTASQQANCGTSNASTACGKINEATQSVNQLMQSMSGGVSSLDAADNAVLKIDGSLLAAQSSLNSASATISSANANAQEIGRLGGDADLLKARTLEQVDALEGNLTNIRMRLVELEADLRQSHEEISAMTSRDPNSIITPIELQPQNSFDPADFRKLDFVIYGVIAVVIMLSSLLLSSLVLLKERNSAAYEEALLSPTGTSIQLAGKLASCLLLMLLEIAVLLGVSALILNVKLGELPLLFAIAMALSGVFILLGLALACLTRSENSAVLSAIAISIPALFISGLIVPYEFMPSAVQVFADFFPSSVGINAMKNASLYQNLTAAGWYTNLLLFELAVAAAIAYIAMKATRRE